MLRTVNYRGGNTDQDRSIAKPLEQAFSEHFQSSKNLHNTEESEEKVFNINEFAK